MLGKTLAVVALAASCVVSALAVGNGRIAVVSDPRVLDLYGLKGS
jgi:hypothetical protein